MDTLEFRQNTVSGILGEALFYEHVDHGVIDHNTFSNVLNSVLLTKLQQYPVYKQPII